MRTAIAALLAAVLALPAVAAQPPEAVPAPQDPAALQPKPKRGSADEAAAFEKHLLKSQKKPKASKGKGVKSAAAAAAAPKPQESAETAVEYALEADAEVSLSIVAADGAQLRQWTIPPGIVGGRKGANRIVWDGRDSAGAEVAPGEYLAVLSIVYHREGQAAPEPATLMVPVRRKAP